MWALPVAVVMPLAAALALAGGAPRGTAAQTCSAPGTRTLLENRVARVYLRRGHGGHGRPRATTFRCSRATGLTVQLEYPPENFVFRPPALALRGHIVGWAAQHDDGADLVFVDDVRGDYESRGRYRSVVSNAGSSGTFASFRVGSIAVTHRGAIAWIACHAPRQLAPNGSRRPECVRPGAKDYVYKIDSTTERRKLLAIGRRIDPSSLRLRGGRVSWVQRGRRVSAPLR